MLIIIVFRVFSEWYSVVIVATSVEDLPSDILMLSNQFTGSFPK